MAPWSFANGPASILPGLLFRQAGLPPVRISSQQLSRVMVTVLPDADAAIAIGGGSNPHPGAFISGHGGNSRGRAFGGMPPGGPERSTTMTGAPPGGGGGQPAAFRSSMQFGAVGVVGGARGGTRPGSFPGSGVGAFGGALRSAKPTESKTPTTPTAT